MAVRFYVSSRQAGTYPPVARLVTARHFKALSICTLSGRSAADTSHGSAWLRTAECGVVTLTRRILTIHFTFAPLRRFEFQRFEAAAGIRPGAIKAGPVSGPVRAVEGGKAYGVQYCAADRPAQNQGARGRRDTPRRNGPCPRLSHRIHIPGLRAQTLTTRSDRLE